jgi:putative transposase
LIETEEYFAQVCRYIALNPVQAGLCTRPSEWPWSSYSAILGERSVPEFLTVDWVLGLFSHDPARAGGLPVVL